MRDPTSLRAIDMVLGSIKSISRDDLDGNAMDPWYEMLYSLV